MFSLFFIVHCDAYSHIIRKTLLKIIKTTHTGLVKQWWRRSHSGSSIIFANIFTVFCFSFETDFIKQYMQKKFKDDLIVKVFICFLWWHNFGSEEGKYHFVCIHYNTKLLNVALRNTLKCCFSWYFYCGCKKSCFVFVWTRFVC